MSAKPWYPWYVGDARAKMRGLTLEQRGAYRELLDECYIRGGAIPADREALWRIADAHTASERQAVELIAGAFFERRGDTLVNRRAEKEISRSRELAEFGRSGGQATQAKRQAEAKAKLEAKPLADLQAPQPQPQPQATATEPPSARASRGGRTAPPCETGETWEAYRSAYASRYGIDPVRNARVNGQLASVVRCVGSREAPAIAGFYVLHNRSAYVQAKHPTSLLARDAEGLRTEWATNRRVSETEARQADRTMATGNAFGPLIERARAEAE